MANVIRALANSGRRHAPHENPSGPLALVGDISPAAADDSCQGLALFVIFSTAVLLVTAAVAFLALFTSWWLLGLVFGLHVLVTAVVSTAVFAVLGNRMRWRTSDNVRRDGTMPSLTGKTRTRSGEASHVAA